MNFYFQTIKQQQYELVCDLTESFASILSRLAVTYKLDVTTLSLFYRGKAVSPNDILSTITSTPNIKFVLLIRQPKPSVAITTESSPSNKITVTSPKLDSATAESTTTPSATAPSVTAAPSTTTPSDTNDEEEEDEEVEIKLEEDEPTEENTVNDNNAVEEFLNILNRQNQAPDENMEGEQGGNDDNARMLMAAIVNMLRRGVPQEENGGEPGDNDEMPNDGGMMGALLNNLLGLGNVENNVAEELSEQDVENIKQMEAMGFSAEESKEAYYICSKDVTDAVNYLLSNKEF